jgi:hypothetical protein
VALHHVDERAGVVVVTRPALQRQVLVEHDVDTGHMVCVQHRFEDPVGEPEAQDVEHGGLSEEVIHPVDLILGDQPGQALIEPHGAGAVDTERLLQHQPGAGGQPGAGQRTAGLRRHGGRQREEDHQLPATGVQQST